jgi:hypothetical protein
MPPRKMYQQDDYYPLLPVLMQSDLMFLDFKTILVSDYYIDTN